MEMISLALAMMVYITFNFLMVLLLLILLRKYKKYIIIQYEPTNHGSQAAAGLLLKIKAAGAWNEPDKGIRTFRPYQRADNSHGSRDKGLYDRQPDPTN